MTTNQTIDGAPLLPCPFCGGEPYGTHDHYVHDDLSPMPCVECRSCSAHLKAEDWNRRVQPATQQNIEPVAWQIRTKTNQDDSTWTEWTQCGEMERALHSHEVGKFNRFGIMREIRPLYAEQPAPVAVTPDLTELREYHAKAFKELEHYAYDCGLRESDVKHYRKRAEFHRKQVDLIDSLNNN